MPTSRGWALVAVGALVIMVVVVFARLSYGFILLLLIAADSLHVATPLVTVFFSYFALRKLHLARQKCPRSVDFISAMPRLPTGKLYKKSLRDRYWGDRKSRIV